ncbi:hypothetical protein [Candidatus Venteria ishoeyi]|uniref:Uncharacterized protein n=1 Tax=Candidatus Venteria ishoeyi TaxID=1899563 RepID=A0A1H6FFI0_9GAMM|nr:hypothetical protein [Candidatus Venteria ishoeyi]SEH08109.1 Uncharacterised protein [Candidatus Venteria ishoeyi]
MDWDNLLKILTNNKTWVIVSALAGVITTVVAMVTVYLSRVSWEQERESKRPYIIIEKPGIKPLPDSPPFRMQITMENRGTHAASGLEGRILILNTNLSTQPDFDFRFSVANAIPPNSPTPWYKDGVHLPNILPAQYVILAIKYEDPILKKDFGQVFFMRWDGIENGTTHPNFVYVSKDEAKKISVYLKEALNEFVPEYSL